MQISGPAVTNPTPELSDVYHRVRRNYGFFSILLVAWEFIGISLETVSYSGTRVVIGNPEAAPYFLMALVVYNGFRSSIEWLQCDLKRRSTIVSRIDFTAAHIIGFLSIFLYFSQQITDFVLASALLSRGGVSNTLNVIGTLTISSLAVYISSREWIKRISSSTNRTIMKLVRLIFPITIGLFVAVIAATENEINLQFFLVVAAIALLYSASYRLLNIFIKRLNFERVEIVRQQEFAKYYVNTVPQSNGMHELHREGCSYIPSPEKIRYLGEFIDNQTAVTVAKTYYENVDGCYYCCPNIHAT